MDEKAQPTEYAYVELFGHNTLGACAVREVTKYGAVFCEARPLKLDGTPGEPQHIAGAAIYRDRPLSKKIALDVAKRGAWAMALPEQGHVLDAEFDENAPQAIPDPIADEPAQKTPIPETEPGWAQWSEAHRGRESLYGDDRRLLAGLAPLLILRNLALGTVAPSSLFEDWCLVPKEIGIKFSMDSGDPIKAHRRSNDTVRLTNEAGVGREIPNAEFLAVVDAAGQEFFDAIPF